MLLSEINKKEVLDVNANKVGTIVDADLDIDRWTINYYVVKNRDVQEGLDPA